MTGPPSPRPPHAPASPPPSDGSEDPTAALDPIAAAETVALPPGSTLSKPKVPDGLRIIGQLGRGGMGVVYRARDERLDRDVAVKIMTGSADATSRARFEREAKTAARLRHPGIVTVHAVDRTDDGLPYLVLELIDGQSWEEALETGPRPTPRAVAEVVRQVADALAHAHAAGVIHRDVKPSNVMLSEEGGSSPRARLMDFGLARETEGDELTRSGVVIGTPAYMAPEQAGGARDTHGPPSDVYGLGGLLYRGLAGRPPFSGAHGLALLKKVVYDEPGSLRAIDRSIHIDLETIALRCLEKEPERRYADAAEVADELRRFLDGEAIAARPIGRRERLARWMRRHRIVTALIAVILVLAGATGIASVVLWRQRARRSADLARARERAAAGARAELVAAARAEAADAWAALEIVRANAAGSASADEGVAAAMLALRAAATLDDLAGGDDAEARAWHFRASMALGEVALAGGQWSVAGGAFAEATTLGVDDAGAESARSRVAVARTRLAAERRSRVASILDDARSGALAARSDGIDDAVFELVGVGDAALVAELLEAELGTLAELLREARREALLGAVEPTEDERRAGETAIVGLDAAIDALDAGDPLEGAPKTAFARAEARLEARAARRVRDHVRSRAQSAAEVVATAQERRLGSGGVDAAALCCEALGRLDPARDGTVDVLAAYLYAESDPLRAVRAGVALGRLGSERAVEALLLRRRLPHALGPLWDRIRPLLPAADAPSATDDDETDLLARARVRTDQGDHRGALADLDRALARDPDARLGWLRRGLVRFRMGDYAEARDDFTRALERSPRWADALANRAAAHSHLGQPEATIADATQALGFEADHPLALLNRGTALRELGRLDEALRDHERLAEISPSDAGAWTALGATRHARGDLARAVAELDRALSIDGRHLVARQQRAEVRLAAGDVDGALSDADRLVALQPDQAFPLVTRGQARLARGDVDGALADLDRACALAPRLVWAHYHRARVRRARGELERAAADIAKAIELGPTFADGWSLRGEILMRRGDREGALEAFERACQLEPGRSDRLRDRGVARGSLGRFEEALADLDAAIALDPADPLAFSNRARVHEQQGDLPAAVADLSRAIELDPASARRLVERAGLRRRAGEPDAALADLDRACALDPSLAQARVARGELRLARNDDRGALADFDAAVRLLPRSAAALNARGVARQRTGDLERALADYTRGAELAPSTRVQADIEVNRGLVLADLGRADEAIAAFERSIELAPDAPRVPAVRTKIAELGGER